MFHADDAEFLELPECGWVIRLPHGHALDDCFESKADAEAWWEEKVSEAENRVCGYCDGSGEGRYPSSICTACRGSGVPANHGEIEL